MRAWARLALAIAVLGLFACSAETSDPAVQESSAQRLRPRSSPMPQPALRRTVYVPVYSSIPLGLDLRLKSVELTATVSVRNVSPQHALVIDFVRYYDSAGKRLRDYLDQPGELGPLATVEFVVTRADTSGGPGANFLVHWTGPVGIDEPMIEAIMVGQSGNAGISFTSPGRVVANVVPPS